MHNLNKTDLLTISGANPAYVAIGAGVATYVGGATLIDATNTLNDFGRNLGEQLYNATHPDQLGQTVYTAEDFK